MNRYLSSIGWASAVVMLCVLVSGCRLLDTAAIGDMRTETESVELGSADEAKVHIKMDVGELAVAGGADTLMQATFEYNVDIWKPKVDYSLNGNQGVLMVDQPDAKIPVVGNEQFNSWDLRFNNSVPMDLEIETGAGESGLDLRGLNLSALQISTGAGNTTIDLSSALDHDLSASVKGGVGNLSLKLPDEMGVRVTASSGIGGLTSSGLLKDGSAFVNEAYGVSPHTLTLDITTGVGAIELAGQ
jgi:N-terminal domain of toast_rack, DUF2154